MYVSIRSTHSYNIRKKACICSAQFWSDTLLQIVGITLVNTKNGTKYKYTTPQPHYYLFIESHKDCSKKKGYPKIIFIFLRTICNSLISYFLLPIKPISSHYLHYFPPFLLYTLLETSILSSTQWDEMYSEKAFIVRFIRNCVYKSFISVKIILIWKYISFENVDS